MPSNSSSRLKTISGFHSVMTLRSSSSAVGDAQAAHFVARLLERRDDVELGAPLFDVFCAVTFETVGRDQRGMHHDQRAQSLHSARRGLSPCAYRRVRWTSMRREWRSAVARLPRSHRRELLGALDHDAQDLFDAVALRAAARASPNSPARRDARAGTCWRAARARGRARP